MDDEAPGERRILTTAAWIVAAAVALYLVVAYLLLPALWTHHERQPGLAARPMLTTTTQGIPGDPLNVGLVGSRAQVVRAMAAAGWHPADPVTMRSAVEIGLSVVLDRPYQDAPVSPLLYQGRRQDLAFEKLVGQSAARRHHVRLWLALPSGVEGREVWLGAASFDRGVGVSRYTGQVTHHIDADLDAERTYVIDSLARAGTLAQTYQVTGIGPTLNGRNGEGDRYVTDGQIAVGVLRPAATAAAPAPEALPPPASVAVGARLWAAVVGAGRALRLLPAPNRDDAHAERP